jgi:hypothetical protein
LTHYGNIPWSWCVRFYKSNILGTPSLKAILGNPFLKAIFWGPLLKSKILGTPSLKAIYWGTPP